MTGTEYFSWDNMDELTSLKEHIEFAQKMLEKGAPGPEQDFLQRQLDKIKEKQKDDKLNISVIGEFSSGKSTFINSLLRQELLQACVLQGTTVASTIIEHAEKYKIEIRGEKEEPGFLHFRSFEKMQQKLNEIVAENDQAEHLKDVTVHLPSNMLKSAKLRVIDTPGLEATVSWHEEKTLKTLEEVSDLSIVLVDATRPLPDSLCNFVQTHLQSVLNQCVFLVTKIDMIKERERTMLLTYIEKMVREKLDVESPVVLPYASLEVINSFAPGSYPPSKCEKDLDISLASEKKILEHTAKQRTVAQTRKLAALMVKLYDRLTVRVGKMTEEEEERLTVLKNTAQIDLEGYVAEQKRLSEQWYDSMSGSILRNIDRMIPQLVSEYVQNVLDNLDQRTTVDAINGYVNNFLMSDCQSKAKEMAEEMIRLANGNDGLHQAFKDVMSRFNRDFKEHFRKLKCLVPEQRNEILTMREIGLPDVRKISFVREYTNDMVRRDNRRFWGGIAAGAAAGSIIPGLGTLAGAAIGFVAGVAAGPNVNEVRNETKSRLRQPLTKYFEEVSDKTRQQIQQCADGVRGQIGTEMERYLNTYRQTVKDVIRKEEKQQKILMEKIEVLKDEMHEIDIRQKQLESVLSQLQAL